MEQGILSQFDVGDNNLFLSSKGLTELLANYDKRDPAKNVIWATDPHIELPILMGKSGLGSLPPMTCMDFWKGILKQFGSLPALSDKVNGKWQAISFQEYYDLIIKFALGLIRLGISERSAVSILGYNCSLWHINFFGAVFANCVACGHYLTNAPDAVQYVLEHSDTELFVVENQDQLNKVLQIWDKCPRLK